MLMQGKISNINKIGQPCRLMIRRWTQINKMCHPNSKKQQNVWQNSYLLNNKCVDLESGLNAENIVSAPTSKKFVMPKHPGESR